jgi:hypothetical protein
MHRSRHGVPARDGAGAGAGVIHADDACILRPVAGAACWPAYHETISRAGAPAANGIPKLIHSLKLTTRSMRPDRRPRADILASEQDTVHAFDQVYRQVRKHTLPHSVMLSIDTEPPQATLKSSGAPGRDTAM